MVQCLGVMRKWVYIEWCGKCKNSAKNNIVNRFTKCVNQFRQQKDKPDELWRMILQCIFESIQLSPEWRLIRFRQHRIDSAYVREFLWNNSSKTELSHLWIDSEYCETIHPKSETLGDTIQTYLNRLKHDKPQIWQHTWDYLGHKPNILKDEGKGMMMHRFARCFDIV
jgi:hypothetical protein